MEITAKLVKELREKTSLGLMDCKNALKETNGDVTNAIHFLKEKGMLKAAGKSGRQTTEGIISVSLKKGKALITEINCETDFVARTPDFIKESQTITDLLLEKNITGIDNIPESIQNRLNTLIARLGENMTIRRIALTENDDDNDFITHYIHQGAKIGVILKLKVGNTKTHNEDAFISIAKDICMHIAAMNPLSISEDDLSLDIKKEQEELFITQAKETKKPQNIVEKIALGKMKQYMKEITLINQAFVKEQKKSIKEYLFSEEEKLNDTITIKAFIRFKVGE